MNKSIVLLMRFEDYLTSSNTVMIEKRRSPWNCNIFLKSIVLLHDYCMFIRFKSIIFISKLSVPGILLSGIFMIRFCLIYVQLKKDKDLCHSPPQWSMFLHLFIIS